MKENLIKTLDSFNSIRKKNFHKSKTDEASLLEINNTLLTAEQLDYVIKDEPDFPFIFGFGIPRSGTTLLGQILAYGLNAGYINNFSARFWLAPVTGIMLSKIILGNGKSMDFTSNYATTKDLTSIHEFGYFWRHWLHLNKVSDFKNFKDKEDNIEWEKLKCTLINMQDQYGNVFVMKNLFGAYHLDKIIEVLKKVIYVYVERDELDTAISILDARRKFHDNLNTWWSTLPPNHENLLDLDHIDQITGQIISLKRYYNSIIDNSIYKDNIIKIKYNDLTERPNLLLKQVKEKSKMLFNKDIQNIKTLDTFSNRTYENREKEKNKFKVSFDKMKKVL
jgi:LPS sulfotransferase NodH